ncbi:ESX secretion-associated protein EspG [Actinophytocola sediminis]
MRLPDYVVSTYEFDVLWADLCLGRMPASLTVPRTGRDARERALLAEEIYRELFDRGLVDRDRRVDDGLTTMLGLLSGFLVAVDFAGDIGYPVRALVATDGRAGVLATLAGGELWLTGIEPAELGTAIVGLLPTDRPASGSYLVLGQESRSCATGLLSIVDRRLGQIRPLRSPYATACARLRRP